MDEALAHFDMVSIFGRSASVLLLVLAADFAISAFHTYQEWRGKGAPLWRNFGAIVGLKVPDWLGFFFFTILLTLALWGLGLAGFAGWPPFAVRLYPGLATGALGALIGARLSDTLVSHVFLYSIGYRPNPGLSSTPLYVLEALFIALAFRPGLASDPKSAGIGFVFGVLAFVAVLPILWLIRLAKPACRRDPWVRWQSMPPWALG